MQGEREVNNCDIYFYLYDNIATELVYFVFRVNWPKQVKNAGCDKEEGS